MIGGAAEALAFLSPEAVMFSRFSGGAGKVMRFAERQARRCKQDHVGPEHILLGLLRQGCGVAARVLGRLGVDWRLAMLEFARLARYSPVVVPAGQLPFTSQAKQVIEHAIEEARTLNHNYVGTEHLLLALLRQRETLAAEILMSLQLDLDHIRREVLAQLESDCHLPPSADRSTGSCPDTPLHPHLARAAMFERFTDRARKVMQLANQEALRFQHEYIGTEHILLGLVQEGSGVAANVLKNLDVGLLQIRREIDKVVQPGPFVLAQKKLPHTPRARLALDYARQEARELGHNYVGTEHLLLGLLREQEGLAAQVLMNLGLDLKRVRAEVLVMLGINPFPGAAPAAHTPAQATAPAVAPPATFRARLDEQNARLHALERQLAHVRGLLGALVGALAGALLAGAVGAVLGLFLGGLLLALNRSLPALLAGGLAGAVLGTAHLTDQGGALTGTILGAASAGLLAEVGRPPRGRRRAPGGSTPGAAAG
jgi:ATP-dependent Clp protease ATP-binding subunit ClpA